MPDGSTEYVGWLCVEADRVVFEIVREVPITTAKPKTTAEGTLQLEHEMLASCEPGSLRVVGAMAVGACAMVTASVSLTPGGATVRAIAAVPRGMALPSAVRVRVEGQRLGHHEQWPRFTQEQCVSNDTFWGAAREIDLA
jgi:hypothetical protein